MTMTKKKEQSKEVLERPEVLAEKIEIAESWIENNPKIIIGIAAVVLLIVGGYFGFDFYRDNLDKEAQREMFQAVYYFEADSLDKALNGDGNNLGLIQIAEDYGITKAGNLANFYAGAAYLKKGEFAKARTYLEDFSASDLLIQARAYSLIGDSFMEEQKYEDAAKYYHKAADYKPNKKFTPSYLMKAALAHYKLNYNDQAKEAYQRIIDEYWESPDYQNARKFKARLDQNS